MKVAIEIVMAMMLLCVLVAIILQTQNAPVGNPLTTTPYEDVVKHTPYEDVVKQRWGGDSKQTAAEANYVCTAHGRLDGADDALRNAVLQNCIYGFLNGQYYAATGGQRAKAVDQK